MLKVAPVRERGLKSLYILLFRSLQRRSRKGAWIEIMVLKTFVSMEKGRSRKGAWIEMFLIVSCPAKLSVAPVRERGLKLLVLMIHQLCNMVAPVRERGLKLHYIAKDTRKNRCRSRKGAWIEIVPC